MKAKRAKDLPTLKSLKMQSHKLLQKSRHNGIQKALDTSVKLLHRRVLNGLRWKNRVTRKSIVLIYIFHIYLETR